MTIRQQPADFVVVEHIDPAFAAGFRDDWSPQVPFALFWVTKTSLTTPAAAGMLAQAIGPRVRIADVQYAGLKDKHAQTTQAMSVQFRASPEGLEHRLSHRGIDAKLHGFASRHVCAADIARNEFRIIVRNLSSKALDTLQGRIGLLTSRTPRGHLLVPNYFGDQRFASLRKATFAASHLIKGDFEGALKLLIATPMRKQSGHAKASTRLCAEHWGDWMTLAARLDKSPAKSVADVLARGGSFAEAFEALPHLDRQMAVESYQSHLWNATASSILQRTIASGWLEPSPTVDLAFARALEISEDLQRASVPMASPKLPPNLPHASLWEADLEGVLRDEGLLREQLRIPGVRRPSFDHFTRPLFVRANPEGDNPIVSLDGSSVHLQFSLPSGAYATNVLRALGQ